MFRFGNIVAGRWFEDAKGGGMLAFVPLMGVMAVVFAPGTPPSTEHPLKERPLG